MRTKAYYEIKMRTLELLARVEYTHTYALIIRDKGCVKAAIVEDADDLLGLVTVCELTGRDGYKVRMWNSKEAFEIIKTYAREMVTLCTVKEFEASFKMAKDNGYYGNRGNFGEDLFAKVTGATQMNAKNAKCTDCGDVVLNGEHIQVKLWNATITTLEQAERFNEGRQTLEPRLSSRLYRTKYKNELDKAS